MRRAELERFMVAAEDDAVLAAWARVIHEYRVPAHCEVPPHEHWESFQDFFSCGIVSPLCFDNTNVKRVFFSGERPSQGDVQSVLDNIQLLCPEHEPEEPMNKAKPPIAAFSTDSSISRREAPGGLARAPSRNELRTRSAPSGLAAFQPQQAAIAPSHEPRGLQPFAVKEPSPQGLECTRSVDAGIYVGGMELNGHVVCCGDTLQIVEEGGDIISPEDLPHSEDYALLEYMFHSECPNCRSVYHVSAGKPIPREDF